MRLDPERVERAPGAAAFVAQGRGEQVGDVDRVAAACRFHTRCWKAQEICRTEQPELEPKQGGNVAACHFPLTDAEVLERVPTARNVGT